MMSAHTDPKVAELQRFLAANIDVSRANGDAAKVAIFQQRLGVVKQLVEQARDVPSQASSV